MIFFLGKFIFLFKICYLVIYKMRVYEWKSFVFWEVNTCAVDTVSDTGLILRSIIKNMSQMTVTLTASDFCSYHSMSGIFYFNNFSFFHFIIKCRPTTSTVEFSLWRKQGDVTNKTMIDSFLVMAIVLI